MDTLVQGFAELLAEKPDALVCVSQNSGVTRQDLDRLSRAIEAPGEIVAIALPNGARFLAALLALRRRGQVALLLDASLPESAQLAAARAFGASSIIRGGEVVLVDGPHALPLPHGTAVIKLSSGSTGVPRGIAQSAFALRQDTQQLHATMSITRADRALAIVPMSFSYGLASLAVPALCEGLTLIVPDDEGPLAPLAAAHACGATILPAVPVFLQGLLKLSGHHLPTTLRLEPA